MRSILIVYFLLLFANLFGQNDSFPSRNLNHIPKNQISVFINFAKSKSDDPFFTFEYLRKRKSSIEKNFLNLGFYYFSVDLSEFSKQNIHFDKHILINSSDSIVTQRFYGSGNRDFNVKIGVQHQNRLLYDFGGFGGIQANVSWFGLIGYTNQLDQYLYTQQNLGATQDGDYVNVFADSQKLPIAGERVSQYLRLGFGTTFGFDWVGTYNNTWFSLGLNFNLFNLSVGYLAKSEKILDPDKFYNDEPKKLKIYSDMVMGVRFGVSF